MKKILRAILALAMVLSVTTSQFALAVDVEENDVNAMTVGNEGELHPYASLNGYGAVWYNQGSPMLGSFTLPVTGSNKFTVGVTFKIESFSSDVSVRMSLYSPTNQFLCGTIETGGGYLTMSAPEAKTSFFGGVSGNYRVEYTITSSDQHTPASSSGRLMCWIY